MAVCKFQISAQEHKQEVLLLTVEALRWELRQVRDMLDQQKTSPEPSRNPCSNCLIVPTAGTKKRTVLATANYTKSYMQHTTASNARSTPAGSKHHHPNQTSGASRSMNSAIISDHGFMRPTKCFALKAKTTECDSSKRTSQSPVSSVWSTDDEEDIRSGFIPDEDVRVDAPGCETMSITSTEKDQESDRPQPTPEAITKLERFLQASDRLNDTKFYADPMSVCPVPAEFQIDLLRGAHRLAQETLWHALQLHWPMTRREFYLESYKQVSFGFADMRRLLDGEG